jgi:uncharacterized protein YbcI
MRGDEHSLSFAAATHADAVERGQTLAAISNAIVALHKEFYGKGPTKARTYISGDVVVVVLDGGFTRSEQTLRLGGHVQEVKQSRLAMHSSVDSRFRAAVAGILNRSVRSFMSANDPDNDLQVEIFVLDPEHGELSSDSGDQPDSALVRRVQRAREQQALLVSEQRALRAEQQQSRRAVHRERNTRG